MEVVMSNAVLSKGTVVLVNGVPFTLASDVETKQPVEILEQALSNQPLDDVKLAIHAVLDAQQELLKINGSMVKQVIQGHERTEKLRTVETIAKLDAAKEGLSKLWVCLASR